MLLRRNPKSEEYDLRTVVLEKAIDKEVEHGCSLALAVDFV